MQSKKIFINSFKFTTLIGLISFLIFTQAKCKKGSFVKTAVRIDFANPGRRGATNCEHPVNLYKLPSTNIAGANGKLGIVGNGAGGPVPTNSKCKLTTICDQMLKDRWWGWGEITDNNGKSIGSKFFHNLTSSDFQGTSILIDVPTDGSVTLTVKLFEPCFSAINTSPLITNNFNGQICIPQGICRTAWVGVMSISASSNTQFLEIDGDSSTGGLCNTCN